MMSELQHQFPEFSFQENVSLAQYTHMKVGGPARVSVEVNTKEDLQALCAYCFTHQIPFVIIGGASNIIIPDNGIDKLVIRNLTSSIEIRGNHVTADSGVITAVLAKKTADNGLTGFEYFVGVPGTVGGAVYNNSHFSAHQLIGNYLEKVTVCTSAGNLEEWSKDRLDLGYDQSIFHRQPDVILSATFILESGDRATIQENIVRSAKHRTATQPIGIPSSGCMYRNPKVTSEQIKTIETLVEIPESAVKNIDGQTQIAAGFLIDRAGLKGTRIGDVEVSQKHATYMVNVGQATSNDIESLCQLVEAKVFEKFGVKLEREVFFLK
jgi:UDP-N-acetylmuramate dehydrogenase